MHCRHKSAVPWLFPEVLSHSALRLMVIRVTSTLLLLLSAVVHAAEIADNACSSTGCHWAFDSIHATGGTSQGTMYMVSPMRCSSAKMVL